MSNFTITDEDDAYDFIDNGKEVASSDWRWGTNKTYLNIIEGVPYLATFTFGSGDNSGLCWEGMHVEAEVAEAYQETITSYRVKK